MNVFGIELTKPSTIDMFICAISVTLAMVIMDFTGSIDALSRSEFLGLFMAYAGGCILAACGCSIFKGYRQLALQIGIACTLGMLAKLIGLFIY